LPVPFSLLDELPSPDSRIVQHSDFRPVPVGTLPPPINVFAVATAVIIVPSNQNEYRTFDVRLDVSRNGEVIHKQTYYNVSVSSSDIPNILSIFQTLEPVGLYLPLIPPNQVKAANILPKDGTVPNFAVLLNVFLIVSVLSAFGGTMSLPGIAGIILTMGIGVDTNVIIFERIRDELRLGKTVRAAVDSGYTRAWLTVIDAHVTTLTTAAALFIFGTGPIRGFAVTLSIGIIINLFTAVFGSKAIFDWIITKYKPRSLSI
jgi:hypothetical protein